ncbi:HAD hydrolase family protein [Candidatus Phytoplasma tritici]|uniref:HAD hydrolase family protein n=1 Tax=Candidatus Phytoplasma tritici TaxID=321961 RepID=UPI00041D36F2
MLQKTSHQKQSSFKKPIYKINLFHQNHSLVIYFLKDFEQLQAYYWKNGFVSLITKQVNKAYGIRAIMKDHKDYQLICMGDGCNNFEMLQLLNS